MDQLNKNIKPCIVKLTRYNNMEDVDRIRDRIMDIRMRKCHVMLRRLDINNFPGSSVKSVHGQYNVRHCRVRLPRLNLEVVDALERSSPAILCENDIKTEVVEDDHI